MVDQHPIDAGASAASRMRVLCPGSHVWEKRQSRPAARARRPGCPRARRPGRRAFGDRSSQMSTSSPVWWLAWPKGIGPPRGWARSPIQSAGRPRARAAPARSWTKASRAGWPQFLLRESRIACQPGPSGAKACAPARQPRAGLPMTRGRPGAGLATADHSEADPAAAGRVAARSAAERAGTEPAGVSPAHSPPGCPLADGEHPPAASRDSRMAVAVERIRSAARKLYDVTRLQQCLAGRAVFHRHGRPCRFA